MSYIILLLFSEFIGRQITEANGVNPLDKPSAVE